MAHIPLRPLRAPRHATRVVVSLTCVVGVLGGAASASAAVRHAPRPTLKVACAARSHGVLRYVTSVSKCHSSTERKINFVKDAPVYTCAAPNPVGVVTTAREDRRGLMRRVSSATGCHGDYELTLPRVGPRSFCVDSPTRHLRYLAGGYRCHRHGEFKVILAGTGRGGSSGPVSGPSAPVANNDSASTDENTPVAISVLANDTDTGAAGPHIDSVNPAGTKGTVTISADAKSVTYDPNGKFVSLKAGETATDSFTYVDRDGADVSAPATVTVTITGVNQAPTAVADAATTDKNSAATISVLANDADPDNDALSVSSIDTTATVGLVAISADHHSITYSPNGHFAGLLSTQTATDSFTYKANDGHVDSNVVKVTVTITGVNVPSVLSGAEVGALAYNTGSPAVAITSGLAIADSDSTSLVGAKVSISSDFALGDDTLGFVDHNGIHGFYDDLIGVLTLTGSSSLANYQTALRSVTYSDTDPTPGGSRTISFQVNDGGVNHNLSNTVTRTITVTHVNHPAVGHDDVATVGEHGPAATIDVLANDGDPDGDTPLHVDAASVDTTGTLGQVTLNPDGTITYDPNGAFAFLAAGATGTDVFHYKVADPSNADSASTKVTVTINGVNDPPVLTGIEPGALAVNTGTPTAITSTLTVSDPDSTTLSGATVSISSGFTVGDDTLGFTDQNGIHGSYDSLSGVLTLSNPATLAQYQAALQSVTYSASDPTPSGSRTISFQVADDHAASSNTLSRAITLTHANHPPVGVDDTATVSEDGPAATIDVLANDTDPDNDTPLTVASVSSVGTTGTVTNNTTNVGYDPNHSFESLGEGQTATDIFHYVAQDPTSSLSASTKVTVTITGVNDAPVIAAVEGGALAYNAGDTTPITATLTTADVDNTQLHSATVTIASGFLSGSDSLAFTDQNGIHGSFDSGTGVLSMTGDSSLANYRDALRSVAFTTPLATPSGSRTINFQVDDNASLNHASNVATRTITVTQFNPPPVANADTYSALSGTTDAVPNTSLVVGATPPSTPNVNIPSLSVLDNDTDVGTAHTLLTATAGTTASANGGSVTMNANGTFTYLPPAGFTGDDTFTYTLNDNSTFGGAKTATGTVTVHVAGTVPWYVDNSLAPAGDGRSTNPFNSLSGAQTHSSPSQIIFVYQGSGSYAGGIALQSSQQLLGQPNGLSISSHTLVAASGSNPTITNSAGDGIGLASGSDVERVNVSGASGVGIKGSAITTSTVGANTTISSNTGGAFALSGAASGNVSVASTITNSSGPSISIQNRASGTVTVSGADTDTGGGVALASNTGATVTLSGALGLTTGASTAFSATGGGTVDATAATNTATTTTGTAVNVASTTIGASGITFQSVSAGTGATGPASGIVLRSTGSSGHLSVTGTGSVAPGGDGSGGTIQHTTGPAIALGSTTAPSFNDMTITGPAGAGVRGTGVHDFTLTNSTITGAGAAASATPPLDAAVAFNTTSGITNNNLDGAVTITNNTLDHGYGGGVEIYNDSGTISNATITNNTISNVATDSISADGIALNELGTSGSVASLTKAAIDANTISSVRNYGISVNAGNSATGGAANSGTYGTFTGTPNAGANTIHIAANAISGSAASKMNGFGISAGITGKGTGSFAIVNNTPITNMLGEGIGTGVSGSAQGDFEVTGNTVTPNNTLGNTGISLGVDKNTQTDAAVLANPVAHADISSNTISATNGQGIWSLTRDSNAVVKLKMLNNTIADPSGGGMPGIQVDSGSSGSASFAANVCADIESPNTIGAGPVDGFSNATPGIVLEQAAAAYTFGIVGFGGATPAAAEIFVTTNNPNSKTGVGVYATHKVDVSNAVAFTTGCTLGF